MPQLSTTDSTTAYSARQCVRIGCAGWTIPRVSSQYFLSGDSHLERYATALNCCEINSSFYREHRPQTWEKWAVSVPSSFQFAVKAPRSITHEGQLVVNRPTLAAFLTQLVPLGDKLGPVLFQLPPKLQFQPEKVRRFLSQLREMHRGDIVFEPRNPSWFNAIADNLLSQFSVSRAGADPACVPDGLNAGGWRELAYFRLHGSPRRYYSSYDELFLKALAVRIGRLMRVWCIFDNTATGAATTNALELRQLLP